MNPDYMPLGSWWGWRSPKNIDMPEFPEAIKNEPAWQNSHRRTKPQEVKAAKRNRARAERKRKKKAAKKRSKS